MFCMLLTLLSSLAIYQPVKLSTTVNKIPLIVNSTNGALIKEFYEYLKNNGASEKHINNNLKA
jgi:hypothetical protein